MMLPLISVDACGEKYSKVKRRKGKIEYLL